MLTLRPSQERGHASHGWLDTYHTFSFADYIDPHHMGFRSLRVINDDKVAPGAGFGMHPHNDMEIITYVIEGQLAHRDSMGNGATIKAGDVQVMTAGRGIQHSEYNPSEDNPVHLLQIWIRPNARGLPPAYGDKTFRVREEPDRLHALVSHRNEGAPLHINQDASLYAAALSPGKTLEHPLKEGRHAWIQVVKGALKVNGVEVKTGDGLSVSSETSLKFEAVETAEFLLFDLA